uniref:Leucine-rich repeat-containing N-terminal plant-type domain-containing protein n=1 Tax=Nelumbo nucifera TaxID=4432 RepID=A0A822XL92_NELNU|nr:TPA_asm: hypothetical protein HUJ06_022500 [Nelumbo nucifera]
MGSVFRDFLCLCLYFALLHTAAGLSFDGESQLSLLKDLVVPPSIKLSWNSNDSTPCNWHGIQCDGLKV